nr:chloramphenicol 3-O-phosphotransferase [Mucilaginibacter sp. SP1R1]
MYSGIIIETHGGPEHAIIVTGTDGNNLVFDKYSEAKKEVTDCQDAIIVEI